MIQTTRVFITKILQIIWLNICQTVQKPFIFVTNKLSSSSVARSSGILVVATVVIHFLNFAFNSLLGRYLGLAEFGLLTFVNTVSFLISLIVSALANTVIDRVAYYRGKGSDQKALAFFNRVRSKILIISVGLSLCAVLVAPVISSFFQIYNVATAMLFAPVLFMSALSGIYAGYLRGSFRFVLIALFAVSLPILKLVSGLVLVGIGLQEVAYLSIPFSAMVSGLLTVITTNYILAGKQSSRKSHNTVPFPWRFFHSALLTVISIQIFLSLDIILVKLFFSPEEAGIYALLSLVGKMIFFFGSIFNVFILPFTSHARGKGKSNTMAFYILVASTFAASLFAVMGLLLFGEWMLPYAFGNKVTAIFPYLATYSIAMALFTVSNDFMQYHLARKHYQFSYAALLVSAGMVVAIAFSHDTLSQVVNVMLVTSLVQTGVVLLLHGIEGYGVFTVRAFVDFVGLFLPLPSQDKVSIKGGKKILIFNWRDTRHKYAGGAEVYLNELAKGWLRKGCQVTWFCGNDGLCPRYERIDGIQIIRRGGFYIVYIWAFLYYILRFRGRYDVIIDSENGVPFFTPLYAKEKKFLVMHHVHQDVFWKHLPIPLALIASWLEAHVMPWAYRNVQFITVSPSTRRDILKHNLTERSPEIVYNGIDITRFVPGEKSPTPLVIYLGRLKEYKQVDVLLQAAKDITKTISECKVIIAGEGEDKKRLQLITHKLGLDNVVTFLGKVSEEDKVRLLQKAWVLVQPSMVEGWGITVLEANACGTPVVASNVPGLRDSVRNPHTGYLVESGNTIDFSKRISRLLSDKQLRENMQKGSLEWSKKYSWDISIEKSFDLMK